MMFVKIYCHTERTDSRPPLIERRRQRGEENDELFSLSLYGFFFFFSCEEEYLPIRIELICSSFFPFDQ